MKNDRILRDSKGIYGMGFTWAVSAGSIALALILTQLVDKASYPVVLLFGALALMVWSKYISESPRPRCSVLPHVLACAYMASAIIMIAINLMHRKHIISLFVVDVELLNPQIPFITPLIICPLVTAFCAWALFRGPKLRFCQTCIHHHGDSAERGFLGDFYSNEGRYQLKLMLAISLFISIVDYIYYFLFYVNVNLNRPDLFLFVVAPSLIYCASIVYVSFRYAGVWHYYSNAIKRNGTPPGTTTLIRFLVFCGDHLLLNAPDIEKDIDIADPRPDTPVVLTVRRKEDVNDEQARTYFHNITSLSDFQLRRLYTNHSIDADCTIFHYMVTIPEKELPDTARLHGEWLTLQQVVDFLNAQMLPPVLRSEIVRLYKMTLAWKTYDEHGIRRYGLKDYKPRVLFSDITSSNLDFSDPIWLYITNVNQDSKFHRFRRFIDRWVRHIPGA